MRRLLLINCADSPFKASLWAHEGTLPILLPGFHHHPPSEWLAFLT